MQGGPIKTATLRYSAYSMKIQSVIVQKLCTHLEINITDKILKNVVI